MLARQRKYRRTVVPDRYSPALGRLRGVGRTHDVQVRNRAQSRQMLNRLMRRTVFAHPDAVVSKNIKHLQIAECPQTDRRLHVVGKDHEGGAERKNSSMGSQAVYSSSHRMLAHAKRQVAASIAPDAANRTLRIARLRLRRLKIAQALKARIRGRVEIRRTANEVRNALCQGIQRLAAGSSCGDRLILRLPLRQISIPILRQLPAHDLLELGSLLRKLFPIGLKSLSPLLFGLGSLLNRLPEELQRILRHIELLQSGPAQLFLCRLQLFFPERAAMRFKGVLFVRCAISNMRPHQNERGTLALLLRLPDCLRNVLRIIAVLHLACVPAIGLKALGHVLGETKTRCPR